MTLIRPLNDVIKTKVFRTTNMNYLWNFKCALFLYVWSAKWSPWGRWGTCSVTCGGGRRIRRRTCVRTSVAVQCNGRPVEIQKCGKSPCPGIFNCIMQMSFIIPASLSCSVLTSLCFFLNSKMSASVHWGSSQWGLQPLCVCWPCAVWRSPQSDWCPCDRSVGGASQSAQGHPCPHRC